jgi:SAM-dependent methyltransferase
MPNTATTALKSSIENTSIETMSRRQVVEAYEDWKSVSDSEALCIGQALRPKAAVLDLGCGAGRLPDWVGGGFESYIGVDASDPMIEAARRKHPELLFITGDIVEFEADSSSFDIIFLLGNVLDYLHPIERRSALLRKCYSWLRPGCSIVGSSHLSQSGQPQGYYTEEYHGAPLHQFRSSAAEMIAEIETVGLELALLSRDYRKQPADWANWVANRAS